MAAAAQSEARQPSPAKPAPRRTVITMLLSAWLPALAYLLASTHRSLHPQIRMGLADEDSAPLPPGLEKQVLRSPLPTALFRSQRGECLSYVTTHQHNSQLSREKSPHRSQQLVRSPYCTYSNAWKGPSQVEARVLVPAGWFGTKTLDGKNGSHNTHVVEKRKTTRQADGSLARPTDTLAARLLKRGSKGPRRTGS